MKIFKNELYWIILLLIGDKKAIRKRFKESNNNRKQIL